MYLLGKEELASLEVRHHYLYDVSTKLTCWNPDYLIGKEKMHPKITCHVENSNPRLSRKAQLDSYDGCARLRPVWDEIASKYDIVITPSVVDEAPLGITNTGDAVSNKIQRWYALLTNTVFLFHVDYITSPLP